jgi:autotransporter-associated beta strand protein
MKTLLASVLILICGMLEAGASTRYWFIDADGPWEMDDNWSSAPYPSLANDVAIFGPVTSAARIITLGGNVTVGSLKFDSSQNYTLTGQTLLFDVSTGSATLDVTVTQGNGAYSINSAVTLSDPLIITDASTGALTLGGDVNLNVNMLTLDPTAGGAAITLGGDLSGSGSIVKNGAGLAVLSGANTHTGAITLNAGTLRSGSVGALGSGNVTLNGGVLSFTGVEQSYDQTFTVNQPATIHVELDGDAEFVSIGDEANDLTGSGRITKTGDGWLGLFHSNDLSGGWRIEEGFLASAGAGAAGTGDIVLAGGIFAIGQADQTYTQTFTLESNSGFSVEGGYVLTLGNAANHLTGAGAALLTDGPGTLILGHSNNNSGGWTLESGVLSSRAQGAIGTGNIVLDGGTIEFETVNQSYNQTFTFSSDEELLSQSTLKVGSGRSTTLGNAANDITGSGNAIKDGAGTLVLGYSNNNSGWWSIQSGTLSSRAQGAIGTGTVYLDGGTLAIETVSQSYTQTFNVRADSTLNVATGFTATLGNNVNDLTGSGRLTMTGGGQLSLPKPSDVGGITLQAGGLVLGDNQAVGANTLILNGGIVATSGDRTLSNPVTLGGAVTFSGTGDALTLSGAATLTDSRTLSVNNTLTISGAIGETGGARNLTKSGSGTLIVSGTSTYTGWTMLGAGTLRVDGDIRSSLGLNVQGGTVSGSGFIPALSLQSSGTISPGSSPGTLNTGSQIWSGGGTYIWEINDATGTRGASPGWDWLSLSGSLTINASSSQKFNISLTTLNSSNAAGSMDNFDNTQGYTWTIATTTGSISGFDSGKFNLNTSGFANSTGGGSFGIAVSGRNLNVTFTPVPEPQEYALLFSASLTAFSVWHRRRYPHASR